MVRLRILEAVCSVSAGIGLGIGGGVLGALIGSYIHWVFAYIFCAYGYTVLGLIGTVIGYVIASFLAPSIGTIVKKIKPRRRFDDIAVEIEDVHAGDHIFVNASVLHQQCHAIVVDVSHTSEQICVIRNAFRKGVVREMLKFKKPVYKALYKEAKIYSPHTVIERAKSKIGEREYSYFNCKRFALWCKESEKKENENIESVYTDNTRAENMEPSNREVVEIETHTLN
ncbi:hypothetical protein DPMN_160960 [Dreissena polymorpha]|uniref:Uncharacterized protein n=2 Tax=Dreissena polymorpha TaxID=45954 RepID=A0A9D4IT15_DREPO|nr:hypothetical protein DPMN_160960 [Dreissena polymorpha]